VKEFFRFVAEIDEVVKQQNWSLVKNVNKGYVSFKAGFFNRFGIYWTGSKTFAVFAKISEAEVKALDSATARYESQWKQAIYVQTS